MRTFLPAGPALFFLLIGAAIFCPGAARCDEPAGSSPTIAARLQPFVDKHTLAGAVTLVADAERVLDLEAVGYADVAAGTPLRTDDVFWIASMSKPITAAALMILVDEGKVRIEDPVEKYLPEFREVWLAVEKDGEHMLLKRPSKKITVRNILSHTSGLPFKSAVEEPTLDRLTLAEAACSYALTPLNAEPDAKWDYSNAGINTAGRIIEVVSGMPYEDFLDQRLFGPLGMKDTTFWPNEEQLKRLAKPYKPNATNDGLEETTIGQLHYPLNDRKRQPMPAGGLFSTAADVGRFCQMVLAGGTWDGKRYLSEDAIRQMTSDQTSPLPNSYGLGWSTEKRPGGTFGHGGALSTNMTVDPEKRLVFVYLVQHAGFPGDGGAAHGAFMQSAREKFAK